MGVLNPEKDGYAYFGRESKCYIYVKWQKMGYIAASYQTLLLPFILCSDTNGLLIV